jgi:hypothetical protein
MIQNVDIVVWHIKSRFRSVVKLKNESGTPKVKDRRKAFSTCLYKG